MFAGFQGWGAQDAHFETSIRLEHAKTFGTPFTGCVAHLWKAFDVIPRTLLGFLLRSSGMPEGVLSAYLRFHDNLLCGSLRTICLSHMLVSSSPS